MTAVSLIRSPSLAASVPCAYAAIAPAGTRYVFLAGACPLDATGTVSTDSGYVEQARACMGNLVEALGDAGATLDDVISTRVLVASNSRADLTAAWNVVRDRFGEHDAPSTLLGVTVLGYEHQLVEIEAIAAVVD